MKNIKKYKIKGLILAILLILAVFTGFQLWGVLFTPKITVNIDIYGTSIDPVMTQVEAVIVSAHNYFGKDLQITFNYLAVKDETGSFASLQAQSEDINEQQQEFDLAENKRKLVIQKYYPEEFWQYLKFRSSSFNGINWQEDLMATGLDLNEVMKKVDEQGDTLLLESFNNADELLKNNKEVGQLPLILVNNQIFRAKFQDIALFTDIVKHILRNDKAVLPDIDENQWSFFNGLIAINKPGASYQYKGINECYSDLNCVDKGDFDGVCLDKGKTTAHCAYYEPAQIVLDIIIDEPHDLDNDFIVNNFTKENKGLTVNLLKSDELSAESILKKLDDIEFPIYVFSKQIKDSRYFKFYEQNNLIILKNNYYILNPDLLVENDTSNEE